ncbi:MAG: hydrogenase formation protein HypD [Gammaproteobacteria bacterium]
MQYISAFRDGNTAQAIAALIKQYASVEKHYRLMEFCGGHTHAIHRYGLPSLLPTNVEMIHGPGCPVCVLPIARIDYAIALAMLPNVILCSYGDMLRVPGTNQRSLLKAKADGADVRMIYSVNDALQVARQYPQRQVIFFAIGFETTTPPTAVALMTAKKEKITNFSVFCNHVLTPVAMESLLQDKEASSNLQGFVGPAHVSIIVGSDAYHHVAMRYKKPIVISGFEPLDLMHSILLLIQQINANKYGVENQYTRAVNNEGNIKSQQIIQQTLAVRDSFEWRGLGMIANSAMKINDNYVAFDAERRFPMTISAGQEHKACECAAILRGIKKPKDCKLFAKVCTPENPFGSCMVSSEGACAAYYAYGHISNTEGTAL